MEVTRITKAASDLLQEQHKKTKIPIVHLASDAITKTYKPTKKKQVHPEFNAMKEAFKDTWKQNNRFEFTSWSVIEAKALNNIIHQLEALNKGGGALLDVWLFVLQNLPRFYLDKSLNAINKNLNGILASIKNGGEQTNQDSQRGGRFDFRH